MNQNEYKQKIKTINTKKELVFFTNKEEVARAHEAFKTGLISLIEFKDMVDYIWEKQKSQIQALNDEIAKL